MSKQTARIFQEAYKRGYEKGSSAVDGGSVLKDMDNAVMDALNSTFNILRLGLLSMNAEEKAAQKSGFEEGFRDGFKDGRKTLRGEVREKY